MRNLVPLLALMACNTAEKEALEKLAVLEDAMEDYETWGHTADWTGIAESFDGTHGEYVGIWVDDDFLATIEAANGGAMPVGAVAVKEGYEDEAGTDLREKVAHQRQDDGTLFFAAFDTDGVVTDYGRPTRCADCHSFGQDEVMSVEW